MREKISVVGSLPAHGTLLGQPQETNTAKDNISLWNVRSLEGGIEEKIRLCFH